MNDSDYRHTYRTFRCSSCSDTFHAPVSCGDRFCDICTGSRRRKVQAKLNAIVDSLKIQKRYGVKFITLTIPNQEDINEGFRIIQKSFRRLRQRAFWGWKVNGGAWVVEVTGSVGRWHVHLHVVCDAKYIRHALLKRHWSQVSPGNIVYIQSIPASSIIHYVTKYVSKSECHASLRIHVSHALKGCRLFQPFGSWSSITLKIPKIKYVCPYCGCAEFHYVQPEDKHESLTSRSPPDRWQAYFDADKGPLFPDPV